MMLSTIQDRVVEISSEFCPVWFERASAFGEIDRLSEVVAAPVCHPFSATA